MTLEDFANMQDLNETQVLILKEIADTMVKNKLIATPDHLYQALAADNAVLSVQDAAKVLGFTPHFIRKLGKDGKIQIDGSKKIHRVRYLSLLEYIRNQTGAAND